MENHLLAAVDELVSPFLGEVFFREELATSFILSVSVVFVFLGYTI